MIELTLKDFKCQHEECPYYACYWHKYSLEDNEKFDYYLKYPDIMFPLTFEEMENCGMYMDI